MWVLTQCAKSNWIIPQVISYKQSHCTTKDCKSQATGMVGLKKEMACNATNTTQGRGKFNQVDTLKNIP
jgi:hypothetical protein